MQSITTSASKLVFILLMTTACIAFLWEIFTGKVIFDTKDFMVLASGAAAFYFSYKGSPSDPTNPSAGAQAPFAGK